MTREKEIQKAAEDFAYEMDIALLKPDNVYAFEQGVKWADAHPKKVVFPLSEIEEAAKEIITEDWQKKQDRLWNMIERNLRAKFINKACKWLENVLVTTPYGIDGDGNLKPNKEIIKPFLDDFKKAMEQ